MVTIKGYIWPTSTPHPNPQLIHGHSASVTGDLWEGLLECLEAPPWDSAYLSMQILN